MKILGTEAGIKKLIRNMTVDTYLIKYSYRLIIQSRMINSCSGLIKMFDEINIQREKPIY